MKQSAIILGLVVGLLTTGISSAQTLSSARPSLIAIQVEDLDISIKWYVDHLMFRVLNKKEFKDHALRLAILELGDFKLELVDNDKALNKRSLLNQNNATDLTGFAKVAFNTGHVDSLYHSLKGSGAVFAVTLRESNINPAEQFFIVLDCDNNWLQFVGPK